LAETALRESSDEGDGDENDDYDDEDDPDDDLNFWYKYVGGRELTRYRN